MWRQAKCWECHGDAGKGDGPKAADLKDDLKFPIRPADPTTGQFKSGPAVEDIFRTMSTGLSGTPMPSYSDRCPRLDRWALAYYVLALSAFKDPPDRCAAADPGGGSALNDPATQARTSDTAYVPMSDRAYAGREDGRLMAASLGQRHGIELLPETLSGASVGR